MRLLEGFDFLFIEKFGTEKFQRAIIFMRKNIKII